MMGHNHNVYCVQDITTLLSLWIQCRSTLLHGMNSWDHVSGF